MPRQTIIEALEDAGILLCDGAWGTFLRLKGLQPGECPELWCIEHDSEVLDVAVSYIDAGADMIQTNSFGASRLKLAMYGIDDRTEEINRTAASLSRQAAGDSCLVLGTMGPTGKMVLTGDVTEQELEEVFAEQAGALKEGGADALCIETMSAADEAGSAVRGAKRGAPGLEIIVTFTFNATASGDYRTMMGLDPASASRAALENGADIVGSNCGNGSAGMIEIARSIRAEYRSVPILINANAGMPENVSGEDIFPETPEDMARHLKGLIDAGADIVGGCCGTTPSHIRAMRDVIDERILKREKA